MSIFNYKKIKDGNSVYIIAEIGVNHDCSLQKAKKMILLAKKNGANAAKFQTYKADTIVSKDSPAYWDTKKEKQKLSMSFLQNLINLMKKNMFL